METNTEDLQTQLAAAVAEMENQFIIDGDSDDGILSTYSLPTFADLAESSKEQQSLLTRSQYAMVVFHGVAEAYPTDSDIVCRYTLTDGVEAATGDRVVLYAVGWSSIQDYVVFEWAPIPEKDERDLTVVFKAADLPKDVNEFYQVCYVSRENAVCGASVPFQVRTPHNEELTFALEEDMLVVRSSTAVAQDKLLKAQLDQENLNKKKVNLEKQLRSLEDKHSLTLRRLDRLQETLSTSNALNEELKKENARLLGIEGQLLCVQKQLEDAQIKLENCEKEKEKMQQDHEATIREEKDRYGDLSGSVRDLEDQLMDYFVKNETMKQEHEKFQKAITAAQENLEQSVNAKASLERENLATESELAVYKFELNNAQMEKLRLEAELEECKMRNKKLDEDLRIAQQFKETHRSSDSNYWFSDRGRLIIDNTRLQKTMTDMQLTISRLDHEKATLKQVLEDTLDAQKNGCPDQCALEKRVAQLQYRLDGVSTKELDIEKSQSSRHTDQPSSLENQIEILSKLLDDSLKENELKLQENMALKIQNEILETNISKEKSTSDEYVIVSCSRGVQHNGISEHQPHERKNITSNAQENESELHTDIEELQEHVAAREALTNEYARQSTHKDEEIQNLGRQMEVLKMESIGEKEELKLEIANLISKNAALVEQEIQSRELKNEMQRLTFMNQELLVQNTLLMERIHNDKGKSLMGREINMLQKTSNSQHISTALDVENEHLREQLRSTCELLNITRSQVEIAIVQLDEYKEKNERLENELTETKKQKNTVESGYSTLTESNEMLLQKLTHLDSKIGDKCRHECCAEPKLKEIGQSVEHLLSVVRKLGTSNSEIKENEYSTLLDVNNDLKYRLKMAHEEYQKLQMTMVNYKAKYNELKTKYMKKAGKSHHLSN